MESIDRFDTIDEQLLRNSSFSQSGKFWEQYGKSIANFTQSEAIIENFDIYDSGIIQRIPYKALTPAYLAISVKGRSENVALGEKPYAGGSSTVILFGEDGEWLKQHTTVHLSGTESMKEYSQILFVGENVKEVGVTIRLLDASGRFSVKEPRLSLLQEQQQYTNVKIGIVTVWIAIALLSVLAVCRLAGVGIIAIVGAIAIPSLVAMLLPSSWISRILQEATTLLPGRLSELLSNWIPLSHQIEAIDYSLANHFFIFLTIGTISGWLFRRMGIYFSLAYISVFAVVTESIQNLVDWRSPSIEDLTADLAGGLTGFIIGVCLSIIFSKVIKRFAGTSQ